MLSGQSRGPCLAWYLPKRVTEGRGPSGPVRLDTRSDDAFLLGSVMQARLCVKLRSLRFKGSKRWGGLSWAMGGEHWRHTDIHYGVCSHACSEPQIRSDLESRRRQRTTRLPVRDKGQMSVSQPYFCGALSFSRAWLLRTPRDRRFHRCLWSGDGHWPAGGGMMYLPSKIRPHGHGIGGLEMLDSARQPAGLQYSVAMD